MIGITDVKLKVPYGWDNLSQLKDWNTVRLCNHSWKNFRTTATTGEKIYVEVTVIEDTWELLKESYTDWKSILKQSSWAMIKII